MKISVITASYNYACYIKETIDGVINQTYTNWEMIIVDDGSKDNSVNVIKEYCEKDSRIKFFQHENGENRGLAQTLQLGLKNATGEWIVFLESDDTITPNYLEEKVKVAKENPSVNFILNDVNFFGDEEKVAKFIKHYVPSQKEKLAQIGNKNSLKNLLINRGGLNLVPTFSVVMLKSDVLNNVSFNSPYKPALDFYLWAQIAKKCEYYYIDEKLTNWRMHKDSYINRDIDSRAMWVLGKEVNKHLYGKYGYYINFKNKIKLMRRNFIRISLRNKEVLIFQRIQYKNGVWKLIK